MTLSKLTEFLDKLDVSVSVAKLIFSYLEKTYQTKKISDVAETKSGGTPLRGHSEYYGGRIPWIKSGELNDGIITSYEETITEEGLKNSSAKIYPRGTLVLALYGATAGKTGIVDFDTASNQAVAAIFPNDDIERNYLFWFFRQKRYDYIQMSFGAAQPNISQTMVNATLIAMPDKGVQREIVEFLDGIENKKELIWKRSLQPVWNKLTFFYDVYQKRQEILKELYLQQTLLQTLRKSIQQDAVKGQLEKQNLEDEAASVLLTHIKNEKENLIRVGKLKRDKDFPGLNADEIPFDLPNGWIWTRLGEICIKIGSGSTPRGGKEVYKSEGVKFIRSQNVYDDGLEYSNMAFIDVTTHKRMEGTKVFPNDILLNITGGSIGRCVLIPQDFDEANVNQHVTIVRTVSAVEREFIHQMMISPYFQDYIMAAQTGGNREGLAKKNMELMLIPLPPLAEQKRIVLKLKNLKQQLTYLELEVIQNVNYSKHLLQSVFREKFGIEDYTERLSDDNKNKRSDRQPGNEQLSNIDNMKIIEVLQEAQKPLPANTVWQLSEYKNDIEEFYAELKVLIDKDKSVIEEKLGKDSYLKLASSEN